MGVYLQWDCFQFTQSTEQAKVVGSRKIRAASHL